MTEPANRGDKLVLIVDDDEEVRGFLEAVLQTEGYQVQTASDGNQALVRVREKAPDLIITDLMMPDAGGFDVLRSLQAEGRSHIPVIVCTARRMDPSTEKMMLAESNAAGFLHKPICLPELMDILGRNLKTDPNMRRDFSSP